MKLYIWFAGIVFLIGILLVLFRLSAFKNSSKRIAWYFGLAYGVGLAWDWFATTREHWIFAEEALVGIHLGIFPIEDLILMGGLTLIAMAVLVETQKRKR